MLCFILLVGLSMKVHESYYHHVIRDAIQIPLVTYIVIFIFQYLFTPFLFLKSMIELTYHGYRITMGLLPNIFSSLPLIAHQSQDSTLHLI